jgi:hypothetical protein
MQPVSVTSTFPGKDNPQAFIVATFTTWGDMWSWEVTYHLDRDPWWMQRVITDFCQMSYIVTQPVDLRNEN